MNSRAVSISLIVLLSFMVPVFSRAAVYPSSYNIVYHRLQISVDPGTSGAITNGSVTTYFTTSAASVPQIGFDFDSHMTVSSVFYHGSPLVTYTFSSNVILISFPVALSPLGKLDSVTINFSGTPVAPSTSIPSGYNYAAGSIYTLDEAFTASTWWPCKDSLTDKIDSVDFIITTPSAYRAGSNGVVTETVVGPNRICTWKTRHPLATYLINFAASDYINYQISATSLSHTVPVLNYLHAADNNATYQGYVNILQNVMPVYATLLNTDYPFFDEKYGTAECGSGWGALEVQSMTFIDRTSYGGGGYILAHELAHQWFGDKLTTGDWHQIWLNEGFAQYFQQVIYPENLLGPATAASQRANLKSSVNGTSTVYVPNISNADNIFFGTSVSQPYEKGAMTLSMLRSWLGDVAFFTALHNYLNAPGLAYNFTSVDSLQKYMQAQSPNNLASFFPDWMNRNGTVTYDVKYQYVTKGVYIQLVQSPIYAGAGHFDMPVPLEIKNSAGLDTTVVIIDRAAKLYNSVTGNGYGTNVIYYSLSSTPTIAPVFDPNNNVLATASATASSTTLNNLITLPVIAIDFSVTGNTIAKISWSIQDSDPPASVEIEKSNDGRHFSVIDKNSITKTQNGQYTGLFSDTQAGNGLVYYRLRLNGTDGGFTYSMVKTFNAVSPSVTLVVSPNPVKNNFSISIPASFSSRGNMELHIYNSAGVLVYKQQAGTGSSRLTVTARSLPAGRYTVVITNEQQEQIQTAFLKQ
jgi:aminopeptidase N